MRKNTSQNITLGLSKLLFLVSLTQNIVKTENGSEPSAILALLLGWVCPLIWIANPILFSSWISFKKQPKNAIIGSFLSSLISLSFLGYKEIMINEAGHTDKIVSLSYGYWLWLFSSIVLFIGGLVSLSVKEPNDNITI
jgi:cellulose synthase/poly-beta-1,6-N-acetylglucosamine synthase-like glycosyltransferase